MDLVALSGIVLAHLNAQIIFFSKTRRETECHCIEKIENPYTKGPHNEKAHAHTHNNQHLY